MTARVFKAMVDHAMEGGSFRQLIYDPLGFGLDAYVPLHSAGSTTISNAFCLQDGRDAPDSCGVSHNPAK